MVCGKMPILTAKSATMNIDPIDPIEQSKMPKGLYLSMSVQTWNPPTIDHWTA